MISCWRRSETRALPEESTLTSSGFSISQTPSCNLQKGSAVGSDAQTSHQPGELRWQSQSRLSIETSVAQIASIGRARVPALCQILSCWNRAKIFSLMLVIP